MSPKVDNRWLSEALAFDRLYARTAFESRIPILGDMQRRRLEDRLRQALAFVETCGAARLQSAAQLTPRKRHDLVEVGMVPHGVGEVIVNQPVDARLGHRPTQSDQGGHRAADVSQGRGTHDQHAHRPAVTL